MEIKFKKADAKEKIHNTINEAKTKMHETKSNIEAKFKKTGEPVVMLTEAQRLEHMAKVREEYLAKEAVKLEKAHARLEKKINTKLENGTETSKAIKELIDSGVITIKDLYNPVTLDRKKFDDVIEFYQENPPEDEPEKEAEPVEETYTYHSEYEPPISSTTTPKPTTETVETKETQDAPSIENVVPAQDPNCGIMFTEDIYARLINDPVIKEINPEFSINDISLETGFLLIKLPRTDESGNMVEEVFRMDIIDNKLYVQAPLNAPIPNPNNPQELFKFVAVPIDTEVGKNILTTFNYVVDTGDIDINTSLFRLYEYAA